MSTADIEGTCMADTDDNLAQHSPVFTFMAIPSIVSIVSRVKYYSCIKVWRFFDDQVIMKSTLITKLNFCNQCNNSVHIICLVTSEDIHCSFIQPQICKVLRHHLNQIFNHFELVDS